MDKTKNLLINVDSISHIEYIVGLGIEDFFKYEARWYDYNPKVLEEAFKNYIKYMISPLLKEDLNSFEDEPKIMRYFERK